MVSDWGTAENEEGYVIANNGLYDIPLNTIVVKVDPRYYRPTEVDLLIGDATKAYQKLGWKPKYTLAEMITEMVANDLHLFSKEKFLKDSSFNTTHNI